MSRDIFNYDSEKQFEVIDYYARSSWAALTSEPYQNEEALERISSAFQRRNVSRDFSKGILVDTALDCADIILIDLIDERFDLLLLPSGQLVTASAELVATGFLKSELISRVISLGMLDRRALWFAGAQRFLGHLRDQGLLSKVVVNKVFWANRFDNSSAAKFPVAISVVDAANRELEWMYEQLGHWFLAEQFLDFEPDLWLANAGHRWGPSPFHFMDDYYHQALKKLVLRQKQLLLLQDAPTALQIDPPTSRQAISMALSESYDVSAWNLPVHPYLNIETALAAGFTSDGIHRISLGGGQTLDLCMQGLAGLGARDTPQVLLVGFSGAVAARNEKKAPFFSGLSIAKSLGLPIIAVSDPTLALDNQLPLAWYAGNESVPDLPVRIARVLDHIASQHRVRLLLFGGSGGGFAALLQANFLATKTTVLVWNPQTAIAEYAPQFVAQYIKAAFSELDEPVTSALAEVSAKQNARLREVLNLTAITHDVRDLNLPPQVNLVYLQNQSDWHVARHALPYLSKKQWRRTGPATFVETVNSQIGVFFGHWGQGHVAPPKEMLQVLLGKLASGESTVEVVQSLNNGIGGQADPPPFIHWFSAESDFQFVAKAWVADAHVHATCSVGEGRDLPAGLSYAFYLLVDGVRQAMRWYETKSDVFFELPLVIGKLEVVAFLRDSLGGQLSSRIPVEMSSSDLHTALPGFSANAKNPK